MKSLIWILVAILGISGWALINATSHVTDQRNAQMTSIINQLGK